MNNKQLYESIMSKVAVQVKKALNEATSIGINVQQTSTAVQEFVKAVDSLVQNLGSDQILIDNLKITGTNKLVDEQDFYNVSGWFNGLLIEQMFITTLHSIINDGQSNSKIEPAKNGQPVFDSVFTIGQESLNVQIKAVNKKSINSNGETGNNAIRLDADKNGKKNDIACVIVYDASSSGQIKIVEVMIYTYDKFSLLTYQKKYGNNEKTRMKVNKDEAITIFYA